MLHTDLLSRFGIFVLPEFLDEETCGRVIGEMLGRDGAKATVTLRHTDDELAERYRRTRSRRSQRPRPCLSRRG